MQVRNPDLHLLSIIVLKINVPNNVIVLPVAISRATTFSFLSVFFVQMLECRVQRWNYTLVASSRKKTIRGNQKLSHSEIKNNKVRLQFAII